MSVVEDKLKTIWIRGNTPSLKNSKQVTKSGFIIASKQCKEYYELTQMAWIDNQEKFKSMFNEPKPWYIGLYFVRKSRHKFDDINAAQIIFDEMTKYGWIDDDNTDEIKPVFLGYHHDKLNPGTSIVNAISVKEEYEKLKLQIKLQIRETK